ncbi:flagellar hook-basal body protein [Paenibacillaceae bacterium WGS1546]|uniref:flagellar hook-basal body protein n=1 Tax=Cohnella sp. WGS1546 TaxID=3366810 RepID=UPI00372D2676
MLRGLYTAASGMIAQQRRHDIVTNNIANIHTPGFKESHSVNRTFPEMLVFAMGGSDPSDSRVGRLSTGVFAEENLLSLAQGDLRETNRRQDFAIVSDILVDGAAFDLSGKYVDENGDVTYQPQAFFAVTNGAAERYTRDGSFRTTPDGALRTSDGLAVVGANGQPIVVDRPWDEIQVAADGRLLDAATGGALPGDPQLRIVRVDNPNLLVREGDGRFRYAGDANGLAQVAAGDGVEVRQGVLERSNVDTTQASIDLMAALRAYEANQKVIQTYDRTLEKAANEIGRV